MTDLLTREEAAELLEADGIGRTLEAIKTDDDLFAAAAALCNAASVARRVEDKRKELTKPMLADKARVDAFFAELAAPVKAEEERLRGLIGAFHVKRYEKAEAAQRRAIDKAQAKAEAAQAGGNDLPVLAPCAPLEATGGVKTPAGRVSIRLAVQVDVVDAGALPSEFLMVCPNTKAIAAAVEAGRTDIPGVLVTRKPVVSATPTKGA